MNLYSSMQVCICFRGVHDIINARKHTHTYMYVCMYVYIYTNLRARTYTHTHRLVFPRTIRAFFPLLRAQRKLIGANMHTHNTHRLAFFRTVRAFFPWLRAQRKMLEGTLQRIQGPVFVMYGELEGKQEHVKLLGKMLGDRCIETVVVPEVYACVRESVCDSVCMCVCV
jgi:hypothetical protein